MAIEIIQSAFSEFSWQSYLSNIKPLVILIIGVVIYSIFIFKFYRFLAKRDILKLELHKHSEKFGSAKNFFHVIFYLIENMIFIPILIFVWFAVLTILLLVISTTQAPEAVVITAIALVAAVRICAYYNEELARELAKIVPLTLLGLFLIENIAAFSLDSSFNSAKQIIYLWQPMLYYLIFVVAVEIILRIIQLVVSLGRSKD